MEYVRFGDTGMKVSRICLGCMSFGQRAESWPAWALDEDASRPFIQRALESGINFFDTADAYSRGGSEEVVGKALKDFAASRDDVVIATKVYFPMGEGPNDKGLSRKHNLLYREEEREMFPLCEDQKIGIIPWSPLAAGRLARKPNQEGDESQRAQTDTTGESLFERKDTSIAERVAEIAEAHGVSQWQFLCS